MNERTHAAGRFTVRGEFLLCMLVVIGVAALMHLSRSHTIAPQPQAPTATVLPVQIDNRVLYLKFSSISVRPN